MTRAVVLRPAAEEDLREARAWYEARRDGLGDEFVVCIESALDRVSEAPGAFARVHGEIRRALAPRFPYGVFFVIEPERVVVLAVFHASRDPRQWMRRSRVVT